MLFFKKLFATNPTKEHEIFKLRNSLISLNTPLLSTLSFVSFRGVRGKKTSLSANGRADLHPFNLFGLALKNTEAWLLILTQQLAGIDQ